MPHREDEAYVHDIVGAACNALSFVEGIDAERFQGDVQIWSAVLYQLLIIGEAVKGLSPDFLAAHSELPWSNIARMRDRLIHHYRRTDLHRVWLTVEKDLPELLRSLEPLVDRE